MDGSSVPVNAADNFVCDSQRGLGSSGSESDLDERLSTKSIKSNKHSERDRMFEVFAHLLLGEDISGGKNGVSPALAISNAITNLSVSVFDNLSKLEPLDPSKKKRWKKEMGWLLSVTDYICELVPTSDPFRSSTSSVESCYHVMERRHRQDIETTLPALRQLDDKILECLESFKSAEFSYVDQKHMLYRKEEALNRSVSQEWWLPVPRVPPAGLSEQSRKTLLHQRKTANEIFMAAMTINAQVLSDMEVPETYLEGLPKKGRTTLGDLYKSLSSEEFSSESVLKTLDLSDEHKAVDIANRIEAAIHVWHNKIHNKQMHQLNSRNAWVIIKEKKAFSERAKKLLLSLRERFPGLPQTKLGVQKIQYNKDVGQAVLESYSRVLESLAFNITARIDAVLVTDQVARSSYVTTPDSSPFSSRHLSDVGSFNKEPSRKSCSGQEFAEIVLNSPVGDDILLGLFTEGVFTCLEHVFSRSV